jgi:hypothetical protein
MPLRRHYERLPSRPGNAASLRGMAEAQRALYSTESCVVTGDEQLAEREQLHRDADAQLRRQGELRLRSKGRA